MNLIAKEISVKRSTINALHKFAIDSMDIELIELMCYFIDEKYISDTVNYFIRLNPNIKITVTGAKENKNCVLDDNDNVTYTETDDPITEQFNYIKTKRGSKYVWYEPSHVIEDGKHYIRSGAYFAEVYKGKHV